MRIQFIRAFFFEGNESIVDVRMMGYGNSYYIGKPVRLFLFKSVLSVINKINLKEFNSSLDSFRCEVDIYDTRFRIIRKGEKDIRDKVVNYMGFRYSFDGGDQSVHAFRSSLEYLEDVHMYYKAPVDLLYSYKARREVCLGRLFTEDDVVLSDGGRPYEGDGILKWLGIVDRLTLAEMTIGKSTTIIDFDTPSSDGTCFCTDFY